MRDLHEEPIAIPRLAAAPSLEDAAGIERVLDQLWIERGSSKNTLSAYRSDLSLIARGLAPRGVEMAHASEADLRDYLAVRGQVHVQAGSDPRLRAPCLCYASAASRRRPARAARQASSARLRAGPGDDGDLFSGVFDAAKGNRTATIPV